MRNATIRSALVCLATVVLANPGALPAQEPQTPAQQLVLTEIDLRMQHYRQTANEVLEVRKQLLLGAPNEVTPADGEPGLRRQLARLEKWKDQLREEIAELSRAFRSDQVPAVATAGRPSGHYLIALKREIKGGRDLVINVRIDGNRIKCVNSTSDELIGMEGELRPAAGGAFRAWMKHGEFAETHTWMPVDAGRYRVMESPDRGENQVAVPVPDDRLKLD